ncbi:transporter substrate-binding domain-containing protein [Vibrio sp. ZSDZ34]|uniref:Transporter substrate-binding domain-containing protein n=1 Tax=Vibrio gelatinilyticus TaxID=2893468 RepID=A0A9X2AVL1_9VIBR|nr:transporter substrate-binding domain-containing protein [Vibrio gelatinilyticus]MCJ2376286.1 transporter substrate-binding domain-containing protein [Vibrio gelatinilyticus]
MEYINFWNGNKSEYRQQYEYELLLAILDVTTVNHGPFKVKRDDTDYPDAKDEGAILDNGCDVLVTVKGNQKFKGKRFIELPYSATKTLLGQRILFVRAEDSGSFTTEDTLRQCSIGIPATWVDAELFRQNNFNVVEEGLFEDVFDRLLNNEFDFTCFGANEAIDIYNNMVKEKDKIVMAPNIKIEYPFPLVFYVNADKPELAQRLSYGFKALIESGRFDDLYQRYFGEIEQELALEQRQSVTLANPFL